MSDPDALDGVPAPELRQHTVGHDHVRDAVLRQLHAGRLPGAIMLHGPQGIGKATLAFELAAAILIETGDEDPHRIHEQVAALSHPNLFLLRRRPKEGRGFYTVIRVEDVRDLRDALHHTRGRFGHRIAIIDSIDDCNPSAANALLKILEEPPPETTFFLISHRPGALLPTIHSRCQSLALRPLDSDQLRQVINTAAQSLSPEMMDRALLLAAGRPRRAFETLALAPESALGLLHAWLGDPLASPTAIIIGLADALGADPQGPEMSFAREMLLDWIAAQARDAAVSGSNRMRLASANELWDKANALLAGADEINLDTKQTLVSLFDAIRQHCLVTAPVSAEPT